MSAARLARSRLPRFPEGVSARPLESLGRHTAWRTGGACAWFVVVHDPEALAATLDLLKSEDLSVDFLGAGTRTLYRDGDLDHAVLRLGTGFARIERTEAHWQVGAAVPSAALAWAAAAAGRGGIEDLASCAGSLGATLLLDPGPWREHLTEVAVFSRGGVRWRPPEQSVGSALVLGARFALSSQDSEAVTARTMAALRSRNTPFAWYEDPKKGTAREELQRVQAAGVRVRGVIIPEAAPDMIVNPGRGPASDLQLLHKSALERVKKLRGVTLASAVKWTGRPA